MGVSQPINDCYFFAVASEVLNVIVEMRVLVMTFLMHVEREPLLPMEREKSKPTGGFPGVVQLSDFQSNNCGFGLWISRLFKSKSHIAMQYI